MRNSSHLFFSGINALIIVLSVIEVAVFLFFAEKTSFIVIGTIILVNLLLSASIIRLLRRSSIKRSQLISRINETASDSLSAALTQMPVGVIKYRPDSFETDWFNGYTEFIFQSANQTLDRLKIENILNREKDNEDSVYELGSKSYSVIVDRVKCLIYLLDITAEIEAEARLYRRRPIIGIISIDNYEDLADQLTESERSAINGFVINFLEDFAKKWQLYVRRLNAERYMFFANFGTLERLMEDEFSILEDFKKESAERRTQIVMSMGISYGTRDFEAIGKTAWNNLELALVRGGDQVVVKENEEQARAVYFGGSTEGRVEKSRTRAKAISTALKTIVSESEQVFVVGHTNLDMDALGASLVMKNFAKRNGVEAYAVYDGAQLLPDVSKALKELKKEGKVNREVIELSQAKKIKKNNALLIMVDHSKINQTLDIPFYQSFEKVVVIDHHRRDEDYPEQALLSHIESWASSATEMAVEMLQFQDFREREMLAVEASIALAGISVDTQSFSKGTTERTFEAAAYLRNCGANSDLIKEFLAIDFSAYRAVNELVIAAEINSEQIAVAKGAENKFYDKVSLAKAADALISMDGIKASFVIAFQNEKEVLVSARSSGGINVQRAMEAIGGGGHFDAAAAQIAAADIDYVRATLMELLDKER